MDWIICIGVALGIIVGIFAICNGIYWLICYHEKHEEEFLKPVTKEAKRWNDKRKRLQK